MIAEFVAVLALFILAFGVISGRIEKSPITAPMIFVTFGLLMSPWITKVLDLRVNSELVNLIGTMTLVFVLFTDAARIDLKLLRKYYRMPLRLLGVGLPLTIVFGALAAVVLFKRLNLWEAAALAIILAPTDAALGQAVVSNPKVPVRIRQALNVESGLNDGICLPFLLIALSLAGTTQGTETPRYWLGFALAQVILGPVVGILVGYLGGKVVSISARKQWMNVNYQRLSLLALAVLAYVLAEMVEGNGFIAAFAAGLTLGNSARDLCPRLFEFGETEGQFLVLLTFIIFGGIMVLPSLSQIDAPVILYAVLSLTVARLGGVVLGLAGMHLRRETLLYLGWFGPRGIASVLYVLLVLDREMIQNRQEIFVIVTVTVLISVFAHGLTAYPGSRWYAARMEGTVAVPGAAEHEEVEPMPVRLPFRIGG